jgi:hypothetical protein
MAKGKTDRPKQQTCNMRDSDSEASSKGSPLLAATIEGLRHRKAEAVVLLSSCQ